MRLPEGTRSRAVLLGSQAYEHLRPVPAVANNLQDLRRALVDLTGLPERHCSILLDQPDIHTIGTALVDAAESAEDLLFVYYAGHGLVDSYGGLHLALPQTSQRRLPWSGLPFEHLRKTIQESPAANRVLILDCCFAGRAIGTLGDTDDVVRGLIWISGTYTLASSPANAVSYGFDGQTHTEFTGALLDILWHGAATVEEFLTLDDIYLALVRTAVERGFPRPEKRSTHTAERLALVRNRLTIDPVPVPSVETPGQVDQSVPVEPPVLLEIDQQAALRPADVRHVVFSATHARAGYDEYEVDTFLDQVEAALDLDLVALRQLRPSDVTDKHFTVTRLRQGYNQDEVNQFLHQVRVELARRWEIANRYLGPSEDE